MNYQPKVTIIIPVYNGSNFLAEAIDAALAQTYQNIEILVINDGSKDDGASEKIALSYGDRISYYCKENGGVSSARNNGIDHATGEWIFFLDADDLLTPDALESLLAMANDQLDAVCGAYIMRYMDDNDREEKHVCADGDLQTVMESLIRGDSALNSMCARLYRRSVLQEYHIRAPLGVKIGEDVLFNLEFFAKARGYAMSAQVIYIYEFGGDSAMTRAKNDVYARSQDMLAGITAFIRKQGWETRLFRAHIDIYLRTLRADRGRLRAAAAFNREIIGKITGNVMFSELPMKQKLYYAALIVCPFSSILLP